MTSVVFTALGTEWNVGVDGRLFSESAQETLVEKVRSFEARFSRFVSKSEVNAFRSSSNGTYEISEDFAKMLERAFLLRGLTEGGFDPAAGVLLEGAGYGIGYHFNPNASVDHIPVPEWSVSGTALRVSGPTAFDLGGIGKGYCIDMISNFLSENGYAYHLVEAGGDMFGTTKEGGVPWKSAIEAPGKPGVMVGIVDLANRGLAVSDAFQRRWGKWHHIVDPRTKKPVRSVCGCAAVASSAFDADSITSAVFLSSDDSARSLSARTLRGEYLLFRSDGSALRSPGWTGELF